MRPVRFAGTVPVARARSSSASRRSNWASISSMAKGAAGLSPSARALLPEGSTSVGEARYVTVGETRYVAVGKKWNSPERYP